MPQDINIRSEEVQEILTAVPNWMIQWGNTLVFTLVLMLLLITWFVKYPDVILTQAVVTTQTPPEKIFARANGKIEHLLITDTTEVTKQAPIAIIENTANYKDVFLLKSIIDTIKLNKHSFSFPIDELPILFLGSIESDYALFENAYLQYQLNYKLQPYTNESIANQASLSQTKNRLASLESQKALNKSELDFKSKDVARYETLFKKGVISAQEYEYKQQEYLSAQRASKSLNLSISQLKEAISMGYKTAKGTQINRIKEEMSLLKSVIQAFNQLKKGIKDWEQQYVLQSNTNGRVTYLNIWNENQTVQIGELVFTIIPSNTNEYIAKLKAPVRNSGKIKKGQSVQIKLDNYPNDEYGVLNGFITSISSIPNNEGFYLVDVSLPNKMLTSYDKTIIFKQEMIGSGDIVTEDLRLIERFFYQLRNVVKRTQ